jgi:F-type H+-transporting ATPase subunit c
MSKRIVVSIAVLVTMLVPAIVLAAPADPAAPAAPANIGVAIAMALAIGLAAHGGGMGQGRAVAAALEGICRNPNSSSTVFTPMLLGLAFIESLVIFALVIALMLYGKL